MPRTDRATLPSVPRRLAAPRPTKANIGPANPSATKKPAHSAGFLLVSFVSRSQLLTLAGTPPRRVRGSHRGRGACEHVPCPSPAHRHRAALAARRGFGGGRGNGRKRGGIGSAERAQSRRPQRGAHGLIHGPHNQPSSRHAREAQHHHGLVSNPRGSRPRNRRTLLSFATRVTEAPPTVKSFRRDSNRL